MKLLTYYSQNYAGTIGTSLIITFCADYNFKMIYNKLIVPVTCMFSSREPYMYTQKTTDIYPKNITAGEPKKMLVAERPEDVISL